MALDRRSLLTGAGLLMAAACARSEHSAARTANRDWPLYKSRFLTAEGRIVDNGNGGISHSEGQGYGLAFALWNNDRAAFARILAWTEQNLARKDVALYSWRYDPREKVPVADPNNATDADICIAWALAGAASQWKSTAYAARSRAIRGAIHGKLLVDRFERSLLLPGLTGFVNPHAITLNPSYYIWPALDAFRQLDGNAVWGKVISDGEALLGLARFGPLGLPTDWIEVTGRDAVAPATGRPPRFGFDAIRYPLYALSGKRAWLTEAVRGFWQGYNAAGRPIPAWIDVVTGEIAPHPLSEGGNAVAARLLGQAAPTALSADYYAASLQMLATALPR